MADGGKPSCKFGGRKLIDESEKYTQNAWDDVALSESMKAVALEKIQSQRETRVSKERFIELDTNPSQYWDVFYHKNQNKFFKDRHWLDIEFPEMKGTVFEVGCGVGNTIFPYINLDKGFIYGCDFSAEAIGVIKKNALYDEDKCKVFVYDLSKPGIKELGVCEVDVVVVIFVLSAVNPKDWANCMQNIFDLLKPGGIVLFRDYARYDMAQLRFKGDRFLEENFYCRGDNTRVYFFEESDLEKIFIGKFEKIEIIIDKRLIVNRAKKVEMYRNWIQAKFRKPDE